MGEKEADKVAELYEAIIHLSETFCYATRHERVLRKTLLASFLCSGPFCLVNYAALTRASILCAFHHVIDFGCFNHYHEFPLDLDLIIRYTTTRAKRDASDGKK